jgi:hypothetical protein
MSDKITIPIIQTSKMDDNKMYFHIFLLPSITGCGGAREVQDMDIVESEKNHIQLKLQIYNIL